VDESRSPQDCCARKEEEAARRNHAGGKKALVASHEEALGGTQEKEILAVPHSRLFSSKGTVAAGFYDLGDRSPSNRPLIAHASGSCQPVWSLYLRKYLNLSRRNHSLRPPHRANIPCEPIWLRINIANGCVKTGKRETRSKSWPNALRPRLRVVNQVRYVLKPRRSIRDRPEKKLRQNVRRSRQSENRNRKSSSAAIAEATT